MSKKEYLKEVLITHDEIVSYCKELATKIESSFAATENITLLTVLKGSVPFVSELLKHFTRDDIQCEFIRASSYEGATDISNQTVKFSCETLTDYQGKNIIIIEDIIDTGYTLQALLDYLLKQKPKSIKIAALLDKPERREIEIQVNYVGFEIPNHFVIGFGLDYNEKYRNLSDIVIPHPNKL